MTNKPDRMVPEGTPEEISDYEVARQSFPNAVLVNLLNEVGMRNNERLTSIEWVPETLWTLRVTITAALDQDSANAMAELRNALNDVVQDIVRGRLLVTAGLRFSFTVPKRNSEQEPYTCSGTVTWFPNDN